MEVRSYLPADYSLIDDSIAEVRNSKDVDSRIHRWVYPRLIMAGTIPLAFWNSVYHVACLTKVTLIVIAWIPVKGRTIGERLPKDLQLSAVGIHAKKVVQSTISIAVLAVGILSPQRAAVSLVKLEMGYDPCAIPTTFMDDDEEDEDEEDFSHLAVLRPVVVVDDQDDDDDEAVTPVIVPRADHSVGTRTTKPLSSPFKPSIKTDQAPSRPTAQPAFKLPAVDNRRSALLALLKTDDPTARLGKKSVSFSRRDEDKSDEVDPVDIAKAVNKAILARRTSFRGGKQGVLESSDDESEDDSTKSVEVDDDWSTDAVANSNEEIEAHKKAEEERLAREKAEKIRIEAEKQAAIQKRIAEAKAANQAKRNGPPALHSVSQNTTMKQQPTAAPIDPPLKAKKSEEETKSSYKDARSFWEQKSNQ